MKKNNIKSFVFLMISAFLISASQSLITVSAEDTIRTLGTPGLADLSIGFSIENSLEVTLGTNAINFGVVDPIGGKIENTTLQVSSSLNYNVSTKAYDDFIGSADASNIIPIGVVSLDFDGRGYNQLSKNRFANISDEPAVIDKVYNMNFKMGNTLGYKKDSYSSTIQIIVDAL